MDIFICYQKKKKKYKKKKSNIGPETSCSDLSSITGYRDAQFYSMKSKEI